MTAWVELQCVLCILYLVFPLPPKFSIERFCYLEQFCLNIIKYIQCIIIIISHFLLLFPVQTLSGSIVLPSADNLPIVCKCVVLMICATWVSACETSMYLYLRWVPSPSSSVLLTQFFLQGLILWSACQGSMRGSDWTGEGQGPELTLDASIYFLSFSHIIAGQRGPHLPLSHLLITWPLFCLLIWRWRHYFFLYCFVFLKVDFFPHKIIFYHILCPHPSEQQHNQRWGVIF